MIQKIRRRVVKLLIGRELTESTNQIPQLHHTIAQLSEAVESLESQVQEQNYSLVKYMHPSKYEEWLVDKFYDMYNKELDFNNPITFNEKLQWIKLYGADDVQTRLADKYLVKKYVESRIGKKYVVPLLGVYDNFDEIDFTKLPDRFAIKTNNGSRSNIIVKDKAQLNISEARQKVNYWLRHNVFTYGLEMHYKNIKPKIIIEKYIEFQEGIEDYKFYCFNGKPESLLIIADRFVDEKMAFYDMKFNKQNISILPGMKDMDIEKPRQFDHLKDLTSKLAKELNYPFVRIDWYIDHMGEVYFGEFTFNPGAGWYFFNPEKYDKLWGDKITLPEIKNKIP